MAETNYKRLTRARARSAFAVAFMSRSSLWLGGDHLLGVDSNGYTETYKRFYFRDIQAVMIRETNRRTIWNGVLLVPIVICFAGLMASLFSPQRNIVVIITWSIFASVFLLPFVINNLLGTSCSCQLRTAVQVEELPSLCRVRQARKILEKIQPLIAAAQGRLTAEEVSLRMRETIPPVTATAQPAAPEISGAPPVIS
jgi:hypothetical protein